MRNIDAALSSLCITAALFVLLYSFVYTSLQPQRIVTDNDDCPYVVGGITNQTINWKTTSNMRGTFSIISSCILTLAISMWSAIHLNIPSQSRAKWQWVEKSIYLLGGILWPEIIAFIALEQNIAAGESSKAIAHTLKLTVESKHHSSQSGEPGWRRLVGMFRASKHTDIEGNRPPTKPQTNVTKWSPIHGFYASMGGFALAIDPSEEPFLQGITTRLFLTVDGLKFLATYAPEMIPDLPKLSEIKDKNKADSFSKAIVCLQIIWFCLQCLERRVRNLPVCLLELTTIAHFVYALAIYALWWKKPLGIEEPTTKVIRGEKMHAIFSYMWMSSGDSCQDPQRSCAEFEYIRFCPTMVNKDAAPEVVSTCSHEFSPTTMEAYINSNASHQLLSGQPIAASIPPSVDVRYSDSALVQQDFDGYAPHNRISWVPGNSGIFSLRNPKNCKYCGIPSNASQAWHNSFRKSSTPKPATTIATLRSGQHLSRTGFCLRPDSYYFHEELRMAIWIHHEQVVHLEKRDISRWSLAYLAISKYGLPKPTAVNANYLQLQPSIFSGTGMDQKLHPKFLWHIALITGLESLVYSLAWNYPFLADELCVLWRLSIICSFLPLGVVLFTRCCTVMLRKKSIDLRSVEGPSWKADKQGTPD